MESEWILWIYADCGHTSLPNKSQVGISPKPALILVQSRIGSVPDVHRCEVRQIWIGISDTEHGSHFPVVVKRCQGGHRGMKREVTSEHRLAELGVAEAQRRTQRVIACIGKWDHGV